MELPRFVTWAASISTLRVEGVRIDVSAQALTPVVLAALRSASSSDAPDLVGRTIAAAGLGADGHDQPLDYEPTSHGSCILGLVHVEVQAAIHDLLPLQPSEREQVDFWKAILNTGRCNGLGFLVKIIDCIPFPEPILLDSIGVNYMRGIAVELEEGGGQVLRGLLPAGGLGVEWLPCDGPHTALRAPLPHWSLCLSPHAPFWGSLVLPQRPAQGQGRVGTAGLQLSWKLLGVTANDVPVIPDLPFVEFDDSSLSLDRPALSETMEHLKAHVAVLLAQHGKADEVTSVQKCLAVLQNVHDQMDTRAFLKSIKEIRVGSNALQVGRHKGVPYRVAFLVRALCLADLLRNSADIVETLRLSIQVLLPTTLHSHFEQLLDEVQHVLPAKSTISRWRLLLDGGFMLQQRMENARLDSDGDRVEYVRYIMADSSMQHGRDFEHILVRSIERGRLVLLDGASRDLIDLWLSV